MQNTITLNELDNSKVGDGVTINAYSDRRACTIVKRTEKKIWVQRDKATLLNGLKSDQPDALKFSPGGFCGHTSGKQRYSYEPNTIEAVVCYSRRAFRVYDACENKMVTKVKYVRVGEGYMRGESISAGRHEFYDFNF